MNFERGKKYYEVKPGKYEEALSVRKGEHKKSPHVLNLSKRKEVAKKMSVREKFYRDFYKEGHAGRALRPSIEEINKRIEAGKAFRRKKK